MTKHPNYFALGLACAAIVSFGGGCSNYSKPDQTSKSAFLGTPPTLSEQAQIKAQQDAQAKGMAGAGKR